jgi:ABC-type lipoprotein release transport system permease subunit
LAPPSVVALRLLALFGALDARVMEGLLFGVEPSDPIVLSGVSVLVLLVATAATLIPAHRATRVDPTVALRVE